MYGDDRWLWVGVAESGVEIPRFAQDDVGGLGDVDAYDADA